MTCGRNIYQFPHSPEEFPPMQEHHGMAFEFGWEFLRHWVHHELRERGGQYYIRNCKKYAQVQAGDIVLFHKDRLLVAIGVIHDGPVLEPITLEQAGGGPEVKYEGHLMLNPESLIALDRPTSQKVIATICSDTGAGLIPGFEGPNYRGPRGGPLLLNPQQHDFVMHLINMVVG